MNSQSKPLIIKLVPPHLSRFWTIQAINISDEQVKRVLSLFSMFSDASPNFLNYDGRLLIVEFKQNSLSAIRNAGEVIKREFRINVIEVPPNKIPFTSEELSR